MAKVGGGLPWLVAHHENLWVDQSKRIDDDFAFHGLDGINDNGDGAWCKLFEGLLGIDVDGGEPAAEAWMRMVPADYCFWSTIGRSQQLYS